jgi:asparagine synthase (glutamine-hydrolysing)
MKEKDYVDKLFFLLKKSIEKLDLNREYALAFSGGLDSCVIAKLMMNKGIKFVAYVAGIKNSHDIKYAGLFSKKIGIKLKVIEVKKEEIEKEIIIEKTILGKFANPDSISFNLPLYFVARNCKEEIIISGNGADELFGGYYKYEKANKKNVKEIMNKDVSNFLKEGRRGNLLNAVYFKKKMVFPYLNKDVINFSKKIPLNLKIKGEIKKYILRCAAKKLRLDKEIVKKNKRAAQYGSGFIWVMKEFAKKKKVHISRYIREI